MENDIFNTELGKKFLALIKASFKVSDLIPDLVLRGKIKTQILNVYKSFFQKKYSDLLKEIDVLDGYLFLAGELNLIKENNLRILKNGFLIFKSRIIVALNNESPKTVVDSTANLTVAMKKEAIKSEAGLNERQEKIMKYFQENDEARLADLIKLFPDVSEKTVRNDLNGLVALGKISRRGSMGSGSFYKAVRK